MTSLCIRGATELYHGSYLQMFACVHEIMLHVEQGLKWNARSTSQAQLGCNFCLGRQVDGTLLSLPHVSFLGMQRLPWIHQVRLYRWNQWQIASGWEGGGFRAPFIPSLLPPLPPSSLTDATTEAIFLLLKASGKWIIHFFTLLLALFLWMQKYRTLSLWMKDLLCSCSPFKSNTEILHSTRSEISTSYFFPLCRDGEPDEVQFWPIKILHT